MGNITKVVYDTTRNTREQKIAVLREMESIFRNAASYVRAQLEFLDGNLY